MLTGGDDAPEFELHDENGTPVTLSAYRGQTVVLYFYPKAFTGGCTIEARSFRDAYDEFEERGIAVFGVSTDTVEDLADFAEEYDLPFHLLADPDGEVARAYDSLRDSGEKADRNTFVVDEDGRIAAVYEDVSPEDHAEEILADLERR